VAGDFTAGMLIADAVPVGNQAVQALMQAHELQFELFFNPVNPCLSGFTCGDAK